MSAFATQNQTPENNHRAANTRQRAETAAATWRNNDINEYVSSADLELKIRRLGFLNLPPNADFVNLHAFFKEAHTKNPSDHEFMMGTLLPRIEILARNLPAEGIEILKAGQNGTRELTKPHIAHILTSAFFCVFRNNDSLPYINFDKLYSANNVSGKKTDNWRKEKLKCLITYFKTIITNPKATTGKVTFERVCIQEDIFSSELMDNALPEITIQYPGNIFECPPDMAQVIFSSKYIGGGVLGNGCGQEDIKFATCPELIAALYFTEPLQDNEALIITGAKPFSAYKGSGQNFEFVGEADLNASCSDVVIAIDATDFGSISDRKEQYTQHYIKREILKAYAGFVKCPKRKIATGNWGGGDLRGDPVLHMKIQWIAAAMAQKELVFFCMRGDAKLAIELIYTVYESSSKSTRQLYDMTSSMSADRGRKVCDHVQPYARISDAERIAVGILGAVAGPSLWQPHAGVCLQCVMRMGGGGNQSGGAWNGGN